MIKHEAPTEWELLRTLAKHVNTLKTRHIEVVAIASESPLFRSGRFGEAMEDFRKYGYHTPNRKEYDTDGEVEIIRRKIDPRGEADADVCLPPSFFCPRSDG